MEAVVKMPDVLYEDHGAAVCLEQPFVGVPADAVCKLRAF